MMNTIKFSLLIFTFSFVVFPSSVLAHAEGNAIEDGNYRVELGSFPPENLQPNETIIFSAVLEDLEANPLFESKAWIRISKGDRILFSSADLSTTDGTIDFEYLFPEHGLYEMTIRMIDVEKDEEANVQFDLTIGDPSFEEKELSAQTQANRESNFNLSVLTLIIGLLSGVFLARYRPPKKITAETK